MQGPTGLTMVKFLGHYEVLEVLVVGPDLYQMGCVRGHLHFHP